MRSGARRGSISLPVLGTDGERSSKTGGVATSRAAKWRAGVLIAVHLLIIAHIIQWLVTGMTVSPVEPSESMEFLEQGFVNAGAIMFLLAIVSTAIFGRFFCGWACHVVALQDLCGWMLKKVGLRPRPFRARLLTFVPLILALYMFVWPSFQRELLVPVLTWAEMPWPAWLAPKPPIERYSNELIVADFWATFPPWYIAIPFLFVCGFVTVYFLGNKGFCTFGCPYGGFFGPVDRIAPVRVRVNDNCERCGHCTAVCTSNVRVHEEVHSYGMVVDPGCMKCGDCITVCPNDALSFDWGRPAAFAKPKQGRDKARRPRPDLNWLEEVAAALVFFVLFVSWRGFYNAVPMLMAGGIAGCGTVVVWKLWQTVRNPNSRLLGWQIRLKGRITKGGVLFLLLAGVFLAATAWAASGRASRWLGFLDHSRLSVPAAVALQPTFQASEGAEETARRLVAHYGRASSFADGGWGWALTPDELVRVAYAHTILGQYDDAIAALTEVIETGNPTDGLLVQIADLMAKNQTPVEEVEAVFARALELHPELHGTRLQLAQVAVTRQLPDQAEALFDLDAAGLADDPAAVLTRARFELWRQNPVAAAPMVERSFELALASGDHGFDTAVDAAALLVQFNNTEPVRDAFDSLEQSAERSFLALLRVARLEASLGDTDRATNMVRAARDLPGVRPLGRRLELAQLASALGEHSMAQELATEILDEPLRSPWEQMGVARAVVAIAGSATNPELLEIARERAAAILTEHGSIPGLWTEAAQVSFAAGDMEEGVSRLEEAATRSDRNPTIAAQLAQILAQIGRPEDATRWMEIANERNSAGQTP